MPATLLEPKEMFISKLFSHADLQVQGQRQFALRPTLVGFFGNAFRGVDNAWVWLASWNPALYSLTVRHDWCRGRHHACVQ